MKVYRYMSLKEFDKLNCGLTLVNRNRFSNNYTTSTGFCFLPESTIIDYEDETPIAYSPVDCILFLEGIATNDVLVEFEVSSSNLVNESLGVYAHPYLCDDIIAIKEYCVDSYSRDTLIPTRYAMVESRTKFQWYDFN